MGKEKKCRRIADTPLFFWDPEKESSFNEHMQECMDCRKDCGIIMKMVSPSRDNDHFMPSQGLEDRIVVSYDRISGELKSGYSASKTLGKRFFKPFLISAAAVIIVLTLSFLYDYYFESEFYKNISISVRNVKGNVTINNKIVRGPGKLGESSIIKTGEDSLAEVFFNDIFKIKITCNTTLKIEKAVYDRKNNNYHFTFNLIDGVVLSRMNQFSKHDLSFLTPNTDITSLNTEFLLSASKDKTVLFLSDGQMQLRSREETRDVKATKNNKYIITDTVVSQLMDNEDRRMIDFVEKNAEFISLDEKKNVGKSAVARKEKQGMVAQNTPCDKALSRIYKIDEEIIGQ